MAALGPSAARPATESQIAYLRTMRFWRGGFVVLVVLALLVAGCSDDKTSAQAPGRASSGGAVASSAGPPPCNRPHSAGLTKETFDFQGLQRTYELYVPKAYDGTRAVPVVFEFHGFGSSGAEQIVYGNFMPLADSNGFLIVAPDGQDSPGGRHFNLTGEAGLQNDLTMVSALLDQIESQFCVDTQRVFSTGMSDGGAMTSVLACVSSDRFAAFAAVAVVVYQQQTCGSTRHVAIEAFSGTADPIVPFEGGAVHCCGGTVLPAPSDSMSNWAAHNGCDPSLTEQRLGTEVRQQTWGGCLEGSNVTFYIIDGGGHTWPGSAVDVSRLGFTTHQIDATSTIWNFFQAHPLPSPPPAH
jgi:polyhydroxybutyrate depolymerase